MQQKSKFSFKARGRSFKYAYKGLKNLLKYEHNSRIHLLCTIGVISLGIIFHISCIEWALISVAIGLVIGMEALNSGIETLADRIESSEDPLIGRAKDYGAAAVFISSIAAFALFLLIFLPRFTG